MNQEQMNAVFASLADAIRTAVTEAVQTSRPQSVTSDDINATRPPRFAISEYKIADGSTVRDYFDRFDWSLKLSKIAQEDYHNYARVHMGAELNTALKILISPKKPEEMKYEEIKTTLINHFDGRRNIYAESFRFRQIRQDVGESLANFSLRLKQAAASCEYGAFLDRMLIEQMIFGVESRNICDEIIAKQPKSFAEAYECATARELTQVSATVVNTGENITTEPTCKLGFIPVKTKNGVKQKANKTAEERCYGCGGRHVRKDCKFKNAKCFTCGKPGHISKMCKSSTKQIDESVSSDESEEAHTYQVATVKTKGPFDRKMITMKIDVQKVDMELDTETPVGTELSAAAGEKVASVSVRKPILSEHQQQRLQLILAKHEDIFSDVAVNKLGLQATAYDFDEFDSVMIRQINQLPVTAQRIAQETRKDPHLGKIVKLLESGQCLSKAGYKSPEINYKLSSGCLTFEHRIVIPPRFRGDLMKDLHGAHLGMVKMKGIARSFIYWPGIDKDIEGTARECERCAKYANVPKKCTDHHWEYPKAPWERVHIDYAGPFEGMMLLIISDAFSKWLEVKVTKSMNAAATITLLDEVFATYGVPSILVSDNGTNFSSAEFKNFIQRIGVKYHKFTAPYHPATNGQAERSVQTVKNALKAMCTTKMTLKENLNEFLRQYRNAPHSTTGQSPAQLFLGRQLRTRLDLVRPEETNSKVTAKQYLKNSCKYRELERNQIVYFLSGNPRINKWLKGKVTKRLGDVHYEILFQGKYYRRHCEHFEL
ncbi:uncharacterized protein [Musca autumnalis]|uniref:uncharacterized protein n=1 Tax=Musca autumnalis TaxID=221902 RepID=UPI003CE80AA1